MKKNNPVNFETFYYHRLLEKIKEMGQDKLEAPQRKNLEHFVNFLLSDENPLEGIEKMARIPGTSDLSIFFMDLIENIKSFDPDEAVEKIEEYARDFLEMYALLELDPTWKDTVITEFGGTQEPAPEDFGEENELVPGDLVGENELAPDEFGFEEFVQKEIRNVLFSMFEQDKPEYAQLVRQLLGRIEALEKLDTDFDNYQNSPEVTQILQLFENVMQPSPDAEAINAFMDSFNRNLYQIANALEQLAESEPEFFEAFCAGEALPEAVGTTPDEERLWPEMEDEAQSEETPELEEMPDLKSEEMSDLPELADLNSHLEEIPEIPPEFEERERGQLPISEEDKQLRHLLRDYLIHELQSLSEELMERLADLHENPHNDKLQQAILEVLKIFKDMGKIHKYFGIEKISHDAIVVLTQNFKQNGELSFAATDSLQNLCDQFVTYVNTVLQEEDAQAIQNLEKHLDDFRRKVQLAEPVSTQETFEADEAPVMEAFREVNERFIRRMRAEWTMTAESKSEAAVIERRDSVEHLSMLYGALNLNRAADCLQLLFKLDPANETAINGVFDVLESDPFNIPAERFQELLPVDDTAGETESTTLAGAVDAFKEVTQRQLRQLIGALENEKSGFIPTLENHFFPGLRIVLDNCRLMDRFDLVELIEVFDENKDKFIETDDSMHPEIRRWLAAQLKELSGKFAETAGTLEISELASDWLSYLDSLGQPVTYGDQHLLDDDTGTIEDVAPEESQLFKAEETKKTGSLSREEFIDDEIRTVFRTEAKKYLNQIEEKLNLLQDDLHNEKYIEQFEAVTHTLKGSAQMLDQEAVAQIARPMENLASLMLEGRLRASTELLSILHDAVAEIRKTLDGTSIGDQKLLLQTMDQYVEDHSLETIPPDSDKVTQEAGDEASESEDSESALEPFEGVEEALEPHISIRESDTDLLEMFREEAQQNLDLIEKNVTLIEKFKSDKATLQALDQAVHELRSAAKMLGLEELGELMDVMERLSEQMNKEESPDVARAAIAIRQGTQVVTALSEGESVSQSNYEDALQAIRKLLKSTRKSEYIPPAFESSAPVEKPPVKEPSPQVMEAFLQEAREYIEDINFLLMKMEKDPDNDELKHHLMRSLHTLKGSASMVYLDKVEKLAHLSEDIVEKLLEKHQVFPQKVFDMLFEVVDEIEFIVNALSSGKKEEARNFGDLIKNLDILYRELVGVPHEKENAGEPQVDEIPGKQGTPEEIFSIAREIEHPEPSTREAIVRLHVNQLDNLLNEAAELVINHTQFKTQMDKFKNYLPHVDLESKNLQNIMWYINTILSEEKRIMEVLEPQIKESPSLVEMQKNQLDNLQRVLQNLRTFNNKYVQTLQGIKESSKMYEEQLHKMTRLSSQIHEEIMQARLVPVGLLFQRFHRPMRDLARKFDKKIKLYFEGESTELDRILIEELYEPMLHILRNAVDHGIETAAKRKKNGKPEEGLIQIIATHDRNFVAIEVRDDGRGIEVDKVREQAIKSGYLREDQARQLTDQEVFEFLFYPGFTTKPEVDLVSGRGVGLDVVQRQIQKIKGDIRIQSEKNKGTRFLIRVPISLTVTQAMLVEVAGHVYALPLTQVEETFNLSVRDVEDKEGNYFMTHRGTKIPVLYAANILQIHQTPPKAPSLTSDYPAIIVQDQGNKVALLVDKIVHREEILIKSLGRSLQRVPFITGGSVLADGKVVLVLDIPQLVKESVRKKEQGNGWRQSYETTENDYPEPVVTSPQKLARQKKVVENRKARILVVDDSISIRKFLANMLSLRGFEVEMAKNGYNALEFLNQQDFDLMITDLEMPHLSGYELIEQVRADSRWDPLPIIVLTGRASKHIQQLSMDLGADAFIIKPFKETELLDRINSFFAED